MFRSGAFVKENLRSLEVTDYFPFWQYGNDVCAEQSYSLVCLVQAECLIILSGINIVNNMNFIPFQI